MSTPKYTDRHTRAREYIQVHTKAHMYPMHVHTNTLAHRHTYTHKHISAMHAHTHTHTHAGTHGRTGMLWWAGEGR